MNLDAMSISELVALSQRVNWELFTRTWWILPVVFGVGGRRWDMVAEEGRLRHGVVTRIR